MHRHAGGAPARRLLAALVITALALALTLPAASAAPKTKLVSQSTGGDQSTGETRYPDISGTGNVVIFEAAADDLLTADTNGQRDVYRRIVGGKKTKLVSRAHSGGLGDGMTRGAKISANGRYVVFESRASNLTPKPIHAGLQVYRRDLLTGQIRLVSKGPSGVADSESRFAEISANGRYVVFHSAAGNLASKETHGALQVYLRDMKAKKTHLMSKAHGSAGMGSSYQPVVSADGRFVAFTSQATNLSPKNERGVQQVFLRDRKLNRTYLISKNSRGKAGDGDSNSVAMSDDGRVIVFASQARNLIKWGKDSNGAWDAYRYDRSKKAMSRISVNWKGRQLNHDTFSPGVSADGRIMVFVSAATNVVKGGTVSNYGHIYRRGPAASSIRLVDRNAQGEYADLTSQTPEISADGRYVVYESRGANLTRGTDDNGNQADIFRTGPF